MTVRMPVCHLQVSGFDAHPQVLTPAFCWCRSWEDSSDGLSWVPATHLGDLVWILSSVSVLLIPSHRGHLRSEEAK